MTENSMEQLIQAFIKHQKMQKKRKKMQRRKVKKFKDLLGKEIKTGDTVLNIWSLTIGRYAHSSIRYRIAKVIRVNQKSIRIQYQNKDKEVKESSIFKTKEKIIVMTKDKEITYDFEKKNIQYQNMVLIKEKGHFEKELKSLKKQKLENKEKFEKLEKENKELEEENKELRKPYERFELLDIRKEE